MNFPVFSKIWNYNTVPQERQGLYLFTLKLAHPVEGFLLSLLFWAQSLFQVEIHFWQVSDLT